MRRATAYLAAVALVLIVILASATPPSARSGTAPVPVVEMNIVAGTGKGTAPYIVGEIADPASFTKAFLHQGGRIFLASQRGIFAEWIDGAYRPTHAVPHGTLREADEMLSILPKPLPEPTRRVLLWWPAALWHQVVGGAGEHSSGVVHIRYLVDGETIRAKRKEVNQ